MVTMAEPVVYTIDEVAKLLKVNPRTVRRALDAGELPAFRVGSQWRITREALDAYMHGERPAEDGER